MREKFTREHDPSNLNYAVLEAGEAAPAELARAIFAPPFLAKRRMVVVKHLLHKKLAKEQEEALMEVIKRIPAETIVVFIEAEAKQWKNPALSKMIKKSESVYEHTAPKGAALIVWIREEAKRQGAELEQSTARLIAQNASLGLGFLVKEIQKLSAATLQNKDGRGALMVMPEGTIYQFVDALLERNAEKAFRYFDKDALPLLAKQVSTMIKIKNWGKGAADRLKEILKVHPFVFQKSTELTRRFSYDELRLVHRELLALDAKIKRGVGAPDILIARFISEIIAK